MNIEKMGDAAQRLEWQGSTPFNYGGVSTDVAGLNFGKNGFIDLKENIVSNKMILTQTTEPYRTNTVHPVMLNLNTATPSVLSMPNKYTAPKKNFGTIN